MLRVTVMVSGGGTNLQAIIDSINGGRITGTEICLVYSNNPNAYAIERAKKAGIPYVVKSPKEFENREDFKNLFDLLGYELRINEDQGVIALVSQYDSGRLQLNKADSILLLILRLLYIEKRKEISSSYEDVTVIMEEIREKYNMLKIRSKPVMDKGMERRMVSLFRKYNIILNLDSDVNLAEARIIIYPSVMMAVTVDNINEYYEMTEKKLREYTGETSDTEEEDT